MEGNNETVDPNYLLTLRMVRGISEGRIRIKRAIPIVKWEPFAAEEAPKPALLMTKESWCECEEVFIAEKLIPRRIMVSVTPGMQHDCEYVKARNAHVEVVIPMVKDEARKRAGHETDHIDIPAIRNGAWNVSYDKWVDLLITQEMDKFRYQ